MVRDIQGFKDINGVQMRFGDTVSDRRLSGDVSHEVTRTGELKVWFNNDRVDTFTAEEASRCLKVEEVIRPSCGHSSFDWDVNDRTVICAKKDCGCTDPVFDDRVELLEVNKRKS